MRFGLMCSVFLLGATTQSMADVQERYAELQAVPEAINDPDPLMRLAQLEAIVAEGDAAKVQLALRTAFTVDDPNVRALALRAHLATYKTIILTAKVPEAIEKDIASSKDGGKFGEFRGLLRLIGDQFVVESNMEGINGVEFPITTMNNYVASRRENYQGAGSVRGDTIMIKGPFLINNSYRTCAFELSNYDGFTVSGTGSCDYSYASFPIPVSIRLF